MKQYAKCPSCKAEFNLKKTYLTRPDLVADLGEYFNLECTECGSKKEYHANDVKAKDSFSGNLLGKLVGIVIIILTTLFLWNQGVISNIGFIVGGGIIAASNLSTFTSNTNAFNKYRIPRKVK